MIEFNASQRDAFKTASAANAADVQIKVVGLGGAGLNVIDRIVLDGAASQAELVVMNTDVQSLTSSVAARKVQLGRGVTRGLGAGGDPELGLAAAEEAQEEIRKALDGASLVFLCVGLGGGTGSGAASFVASLAKEHGALVVALATTPFAFEGRRRAAQSEEALVTLQAVADAVICFDNDVMGDAVPPKAGIHQAFAAADETISQSVRAVSSLFTQPGILHIGFDDLCAALRPGAGGIGRCLFGYGEAEGDNRAHEALTRALRNPLMDRGRMLQEAHNILVNVGGGPDMTLNEVQILMEALGKQIGDETQILFGASVDSRMGSRMGVTIISSAAMALSSREAAPRFVPAAVALPRVELPAPPPAEEEETAAATVAEEPELMEVPPAEEETLPEVAAEEHHSPAEQMLAAAPAAAPRAPRAVNRSPASWSRTVSQPPRPGRSDRKRFSSSQLPGGGLRKANLQSWMGRTWMCRLFCAGI